MNWHAIRAIYIFEMSRTFRTIAQSVISPVVSTVLYFVVFGTAIGSRIPDEHLPPFGLLAIGGPLIDAGHEVVALDRVHSKHLDGRAHWQELDIFDTDGLQRALDGVELVFHLVAKISLAQEDKATWHVNVEGVKAVAEGALAAGLAGGRARC